MPPGGDGYYYFSVYLHVAHDEFGRFNIEMNGNLLCSASTDEQDTPLDPRQAACSAATFAAEGMNFYGICIFNILNTKKITLVFLFG